MRTSKSAVGDVDQKPSSLRSGGSIAHPLPSQARIGKNDTSRAEPPPLSWKLAPRGRRSFHDIDTVTRSPAASARFTTSVVAFGPARRHRAPTGRHGADRQTCAAPCVERRVRPEPKDEAVGWNRGLERDGERARRFLEALTDTHVEDIARPVPRCAGEQSAGPSTRAPRPAHSKAVDSNRPTAATTAPARTAKDRIASPLRMVYRFAVGRDIRPFRSARRPSPRANRGSPRRARPRASARARRTPPAPR